MDKHILLLNDSSSSGKFYREVETYELDVKESRKERQRKD